LRWVTATALAIAAVLFSTGLLDGGPLLTPEPVSASLTADHSHHHPGGQAGSQADAQTDGYGLANRPAESPVNAPASLTCPARPPIRVLVAPESGRLRVTLTTATSASVPTNGLQVVRFAAFSGARVVLLDGTAFTSSRSIPLSPAPTSYQFFVERLGAGGVTVPLTVEDACGEWSTFVGAGAATFDGMAPTATPTSTGTSTPIPTSTPTSTATATATATAITQPVAGQLCPQWYHDAITVLGPDGLAYPTWHPAVDQASGCSFGHEHGADPRTSVANSALPPFGYIGAMANHAPEPHEGFKVFIAALGTPGDNGPMQADVRIVFHMGTARIGRYTNQHHSMMFDIVHPDGRYAHIQGMADTGVPIGSTCSVPRTDGRDFSTVSCNDAYEIWNVALKIVHPSDPFQGVNEVRFTGAGAVATFDPITTRDPADNARLIYTEQYRRGASFDPLLPTAQYRGCKREFYNQTYWNNGTGRPGSSTVYWTDAMGLVNPGGQAPGLLKQQIGQTGASSLPSFKRLESFCDGTVRTPN
jgi:hypothetical protein